jgi:hypothetical protein
LAGENVMPVGRDFADVFLDKFSDPLSLSVLEDKVYGEFGFPVLCSVLPDSDKLKPRDVCFYHEGEFRASVFSERPFHIKHLAEIADAFFAVRLLVHSDDYFRASSVSDSLFSFFSELVLSDFPDE